MPRITVEEFVENWEKAGRNITGLDSTQAIEAQREIRKANTCISSAQYGRLLPEPTETMLLDLLQLKSSDIFVDFGHGLGNAVMQAAYTHGCTSRGIEIVKGRYDMSLTFRKQLVELVGHAAVELRNGELQKAEHRHFLT